MSLAAALKKSLDGTGTLGKIQVENAIKALEGRRNYLCAEWDTNSRHHQKKYSGAEIRAIEAALFTLKLILQSNDVQILKNFESDYFIKHWTEQTV